MHSYCSAHAFILLFLACHNMQLDFYSLYAFRLGLFIVTFCAHFANGSIFQQVLRIHVNKSPIKMGMQAVQFRFRPESQFHTYNFHVICI